ncbi:MAG: trypsin-like peptidase domain-containing protein [Lachnospiraceae bacterium]|nr:trypsin-like peptidase domain-containing protein [Candidatus Merdinaster equi]
MKSNRNRLFAAVLSIVFVVACALSINTIDAKADKGKQSILDSRNGVVRVMYESPQMVSTGSAFGVGVPGEETCYWVTCYHVVNPNYSDKETYEPVYISTGESLTDSVYSVDVLFADAKLDIAVLKTYKPIEGRVALPLIESKAMAPTMTIYTLGFPGVSDLVSDNYNLGKDLSSLTEDETITTGTITRTKVVADNVQYFQVDADINHGNSGGPTVTEEGYVIGVNESIIRDPNGGNYLGLVTHADYVMDVLDDLGIDYVKKTDSDLTQTTVDPTVNTGDDDSVIEIQPDEIDNFSSKGLGTIEPITIIIIAAIALILIFMIIFMISTVRRSKRLEAQIAKEREQYMSYGRIVTPQKSSAPAAVPGAFAQPAANSGAQFAPAGMNQGQSQFAPAGNAQAQSQFAPAGVNQAQNQFAPAGANQAQNQFAPVGNGQMQSQYASVETSAAQNASVSVAAEAETASQSELSEQIQAAAGNNPVASIEEIEAARGDKQSKVADEQQIAMAMRSSAQVATEEEILKAQSPKPVMATEMPKFEQPRRATTIQIQQASAPGPVMGGRPMMNPFMPGAPVAMMNEQQADSEANVTSAEIVEEPVSEQIPVIPSVFGSAGYYAGRNFEISTSIVMGRSKARCHLVYPQDTPGISNVHVEVLNRDGKLYALDRGSSYGTFVNTSTKLTAGQPYELKDGDTISLASAANMFTVKY